MNNNLVSIIVPVYNVEKYLKKCIESIINQTYKNIEIILVDDGSPDTCGEICDKYANTDNRIKVIHKANEGVSVARNEGIEASNGEFIVFVDSDDFIEPNSIEILVNKQNEKDYDLVSGKMNRITNEKIQIPEIHIGEYFNDSIFENIFTILDVYGMMGPCAKLFKTDIIKQNKVLFVKGVTFGEDSIFVLEYIEKCKSIAIVDNVIYNYICYNENSATNKYHENFYIYSKQFTDILKRILEKIRYTNKVENKFRNYCTTKLTFVMFYYLQNSPTKTAKYQDIGRAFDAYKDEINIKTFQKTFTKTGVSLLMKEDYVGFLRFYKILKVYHIFKRQLKRVLNQR